MCSARHVYTTTEKTGTLQFKCWDQKIIISQKNTRKVTKRKRKRKPTNTSSNLKPVTLKDKKCCMKFSKDEPHMYHQVRTPPPQ
jgi:hypothetical protein